MAYRGYYQDALDSGDVIARLQALMAHQVARYRGQELLDQLKSGTDPKLVRRDDGYTLAHYACQSGNLNFVKFLFEKHKCNLTDEAKGCSHMTPLACACQYGHLDIVRYLIEEHHCNIHMVEQWGQTPLHYAFQGGHFDLVHYLITNQHCKACCSDDRKRTPLHWCCTGILSSKMQDVLKIMRFLISFPECDVNKKDNHGNSAFLLSCQYKYTKLAHFLITEGHCDVTLRNDDGNTALHVPCLYIYHGIHTNTHEVEVMEFLLRETMINPNSKNNQGDTPLHMVCKQEHCMLVNLLIRDERCNPHESNSRGDTALHVACAHNKAEDISKLLLEEAKLDPNAKNDDGDTPLHLACRSEKTTFVILLLRDNRCHPNEKNSNGDTALHVSCGLNSAGISALLLKHAKIDPNVKNNAGDTPLHLVRKSTNEAQIKVLLRHERCSLNEKNGYGKTPQLLHWASRYKIMSLLEFLVKDKRCDPNEKDSNGDTAIHFACHSMYQKGVLEVVQLLLEETEINPDESNNNGQTPLDYTSDPNVIRELIRHGANPRNVYKTHGKILGRRSSKQPPQTPVKLFIVGNPSAGKSTLTKALQSEAFGLNRVFSRFLRVSDVDEKTAGIVPHDFESKAYGRVTLYDFAGQPEFYGSHAAVLQNAMQSSTPIFLLVVDLNISNEDVRRNIFYWVSFLVNQCSLVTGKPHFVVVGSHADVLQSRGENPKHKASFIISLLSNSQFPSLEFTGFIAMDCQYADSAGMTELHSVLKKSCDRLRIQDNINFSSHCFLVYLMDKFRDSAALTLTSIHTQIKEFKQAKPSIDDLEDFVPSSITSIQTICEQLNDRGHLLVLKNPTAIEQSWVILNQTALLAEVNGTIFAPKGFKEHIKLASSTGVVPLSSIMKYFPNHDLAMLIGFLSHLEFCHEISDPEILALINKELVSTVSETQSTQEERYFFFPGLVILDVPSTVWEPQPLFDYHCGWILHCAQPEQFFGPRFLQVLLLRLAFSFAFKKASSIDVPSLQRKCSIWKNGIYWGDGSCIETLVEIADQNRVVVLMRCPEISSSCLQLRSLLIQRVLVVAREFCSKVSTIESFINPLDTIQYPLKPTSQLTLYNMTDIANAVVGSMLAVVDNAGKPISLDSLLSFEPYADVVEPILRELLQEDPSYCNTKISEQFISQMALRISKRSKVFQEILEVNPFQLEEKMSCEPANTPLYRARHMMMIWRNTCEGTYQCLREKLDQFSVFAGRNPLEITGVSFEVSAQQTEFSTTDHDSAIITANSYVVSLTDVDMLAELLSEVAAHWDLFLGLLGLSQAIRDEIKHDNARFPKFSKRCLLDGIRRWVESEDRPTYCRITTVLRGTTLYNETLAQRVEEFAESRYNPPS